MKNNLTQTTGNILYRAGTEFGPNYRRVGMTSNGRSPYDRWNNDGDYRKCGNPAQFPHEFYDIGTHTDHEVHALLKRTPGVSVASHDVVRSPEVFYCEHGGEHLDALVESYVAVLTGRAMPIRDHLAARPYQHAFVEQFKSTQGDFCLFAKCRSGKSVMTLLAATESDYRSIAVVSYRTSAANSWRDDARRYTVFHEWDVIDLSSPTWEFEITSSKKASRRQLLISTVQRQREEFGYVEKLAAQYPNGVDLLALDECHVGGESNGFLVLKKNLKYNRLLEISGTAYKTIFKYPKERVFVWGYVEEQRAKAQGYEWAQSLPRMELVFAKFNAKELGSVYGDDPDALKNVFSVEDGKWKDPGSVQAFLRKYFPYGAMCRKQHQILHGSQHIVMTLPSKAACHLFAKTLREFGSPFAPIVVTSDTGNGQEDILRHVRSNESTITLTKWANVLGVTVPQWDTVIHACEYDSAEFWVQLTFRGGSTTLPSWRVIDLAPERALQSVLEMASATSAAHGEEDAFSVLRTLLDFADVFEFNEGFTKLNYDSILASGIVGISSAKAETHAAMAEVVVGDNVQAVAWALEGIKGAKDVEALLEVVNANGTQGSSNAQIQRQVTASNEDSKARAEALKSAKTAVGKLDDVIADGLLHGVQLSTLPQLLSYDQFKLHTGCDPEVFQFVIDSGWINPQSLNIRVSRMHLSIATAFAGCL